MQFMNLNKLLVAAMTTLLCVTTTIAKENYGRHSNAYGEKSHDSGCLWRRQAHLAAAAEYETQENWREVEIHVLAGEYILIFPVMQALESRVP